MSQQYSPSRSQYASRYGQPTYGQPTYGSAYNQDSYRYAPSQYSHPDSQSGRQGQGGDYGSPQYNHSRSLHNLSYDHGYPNRYGYGYGASIDHGNPYRHGYGGPGASAYGASTSTYAYELDKVHDKNVEGVKDERRERLEQQHQAQQAYDHAREEKERRLRELEGNVQTHKQTADHSREDYNRAVNDYQYGSQSYYSHPYGHSPYWSQHQQERQKDRLDKVGDERHKSTEATSQYHHTKVDAEREAEQLEHDVADLEKQLNSAKDMRRRNSIKLEQTVANQENAPWRSHGYGYGSQASANLRTEAIKSSLNTESQLKHSHTEDN